MKLGVRTKLVLGSLGLIILALLAADLLLTRPLDRLLTGRTREDLLVRAELAEREVSALYATGIPRDDPAWERAARDLALRARARVTLVDADGRVLGDSEIGDTGLSALENHRERPEISSALASHRGWAIRQSATLGQRMLYVAISFPQHQPLFGVIRFALPLSQVDEAIGQLRRALVAASLLALGFAAVTAAVTAHWSSRTLRRLTQAADRMVGGNLSARTRMKGHDEIASLGQSLDRMAQNLGAAMDALGSERDLLEGILDSMQEGVLVVARDGRIIHMNPALRDMLLLGAEALDKPLPAPLRESALASLLEAGGSSLPEPIAREVELGGLKPRRLLVRVSSLPGNSGDLLAVLVDVTDLRRLETLRRDFVANVSHELRTPVTVLRSAAETLGTALGDPQEARGFLEIIERNAERLQNLVEDLLDLSRLESREFRLQSESVPVDAFVDRLVDQFKTRTAARNLALETVILPSLVVWADPRALEQVLGNLLDNAVKYCPAGSRISILGGSEDGMARISVCDSGPGIEARHLPRLFERFYRVDSGRSRELGGTGLGLAIVKHLVEAMGGGVRVESEPGKGSTFTFTLPLRGPAAAGDAATEGG